MKIFRAVLLMENETALRVQQLANEVGIQLNAVVVNDLAALGRGLENPHDLLLSFGTSVIVPKRLLDLPGLLAINVHAASPDYPGRDPHHFAIYHNATRYGATMHFMTSLVDAGQIIDVEFFDVSSNATPKILLDQANEAGFVLIARLFHSLTDGIPLVPLQNAAWGKKKSTRKMFEELCRVDIMMPAVEFNRRLRATAMPGYSNLYMEVHGHRFRIESKI